MITPVEIEGLEKVYHPGLFRNPQHALRGLDLTVRAGEIYGLVGPNGAGKTTTLKILLGLLRPTGGRGTLLGRPLGDREARARLGFLPELPAYHPHLTPREVLAFARALSGVRRDAPADRGLLEDLGLGSAAGRPIRKLSKGQIQRVGLAQALVHGPELLILDEPMSGLDPIGRALVKERLGAERSGGRTILLSSHVLADIEALADTVGLIAEGRMRVEGSPQELLSQAAYAVTIEGSGRLPEGILAGLPRGSSLSEAQEGWVLRLPQPEQMQFDGCLRRILNEGCAVTRIETEREDLESFFVRTVAGEEGVCRT